MIFVTLGTQDKPFERLIKAVEEQVIRGNIKDEVIVQAGFTKYKSEKIKILEYIPIDEFEKYIKQADIIITHAGVGSIIMALENNKKVIAGARLKQYGEHVNDHQLQILDNFSENGYILKLDRFEDLDKVLEKAKNFVPKKFESNNKNFVNSLRDEMQNLLQQ